MFVNGNEEKTTYTRKKETNIDYKVEKKNKEKIVKKRHNPECKYIHFMYLMTQILSKKSIQTTTT